MADVEFTWKIDRMGVLDLDSAHVNYVVEVAWSLTGLLPGATGVNPLGMIIGNRTQLDRSLPQEFTAYDQITEAQAIEWLLATLGPAQVAELKDRINSELQGRLTPPAEVIKDQTPPWLSTSQ
jgi:hypothetical protein